MKTNGKKLLTKEEQDRAVKLWSKEILKSMRTGKRVLGDVFRVSRKGDKNQRSFRADNAVIQTPNNLPRSESIESEKTTQAPSVLNKPNEPEELYFTALTEEEAYIEKIMSVAGKNLNTLTLKTELYFEERDWNHLSAENKKILTTWMHEFKTGLDKAMFNWSITRNAIRKDILGSEAFETALSKIKKITISDHSLNETFQRGKVFSDACFAFDLEKFKKKLPVVPSVLVSTYKKTKENNRERLPLKPVSEIENTKKYFTESLENLTESFLALPLYSVDTRDCFVFDPIVKETTIQLRDRNVIKKEYYFDPNHLPSNWKYFQDSFPDYRIGVVTYDNLFSHEELLEIENKCHQTEVDYYEGKFLPNTGQSRVSGNLIKRTKFFFEYRYLWSANQLREAFSDTAAGIRCDVSSTPLWMKKLVERRLVQSNIIPEVAPRLKFRIF